MLVPRPDTPTFSLLVLFKSGSRHETKGLFGAAHFIEHMVFKGTSRRPTARDISRELDSIGAEFNAFTAKDYSGFYVKSGMQNSELACDVLSDIVWHSKFDANEMKKEKGVVIEEVKMYEENPLMRIDDIFEQELYGGNPLSRIISGTKEDVLGYDRKKILAFQEAMYGPGNILIAAVGNVGEKMEALIKKFFGRKKAGRKSSLGIKKFKGVQKSPRLVVEKKDVTQVQAALGFPAVGMLDDRQYAARLLAVVLGGNMSSRLFLKVREEQGLAYSINAYLKAFEDTGHLAIYGGIDLERIDKALKLIMAELKKIREKGISKKELALARNFIKGKTVLALEDSASAASYYGKQALLAKKVLSADEMFEKFDAVSTQDILRVARDIIRPNLLNIALIGPFRDKERLVGLEKLL